MQETLIATGIPAPRIIVSGVNPHASEGGLFGEEEAEIIAPAIEDARVKGIQLEGPVPADLMLQGSTVSRVKRRGQVQHQAGVLPLVLLMLQLT